MKMAAKHRPTRVQKQASKQPSKQASERAKNGIQRDVDQKQPKNQPKTIPKSAQNRPKVDPKSSHHRSKIGSEAELASETVFGPIVIPFWVQLGAILGAKIEACWGHVDQQIDFLRVQKATENKHDLQYCSGPSWADFGTILGSKIDPKSIQNLSEERRSKKSKNVKKPIVFQCFLLFRRVENRSKIDQNRCQRYLK